MKRFAIALTGFVYAILFFCNQAQADEFDDLPAITYTMGACIMLNETRQKLVPFDETIGPKIKKIEASHKAEKISLQDALKQATEAYLNNFRTVYGMAGYNFDKSLVNFVKLCQTYNSCGNFVKKSEHLDANGGGICIASELDMITMMFNVNAEWFRPYLPRNLQNALAPLPTLSEDRDYY